MAKRLLRYINLNEDDTWDGFQQSFLDPFAGCCSASAMVKNIRCGGALIAQFHCSVCGRGWWKTIGCKPNRFYCWRLVKASMPYAEANGWMEEPR